MFEILLLPYNLDHGFLSEIEPVGGQIWWGFLGAKAEFGETENLAVCVCCQTGALPNWAFTRARCARNRARRHARFERKLK
jgi:hypothetical protein